MPKRLTPAEKTARAARDAAICDQYTAGATIDTIAASVGLTTGRIHQILRAYGLRSGDRPRPHNGRDEFLGIELEEMTKIALRQEAERRGLSMSKLSADVLRDMLIACGYPLEAERVS